MRHRILASIALLVFMMAVPSAYAQAVLTGTVEGMVTDISGAVIPGVTVTLTDADRGGIREVLSDERGGFRFIGIQLFGTRTVLESSFNV